MRKLNVFIEKKGLMQYVGYLSGNSSADTCFRYAEEYLVMPDSKAISISLPLQHEPFSPEKTKVFFDGLLPEGFTRRTVTQMAHLDESDYISILEILGRECIGAVRIVEEDSPAILSYKPLSNYQIKQLAGEGTTKSAEIVTKTHLSLTGASGKTGLYFEQKTGQWYLPVGDAPSTHIVKQSHVRLKSIIANEQLCLMAAGFLGLDVPNSFIVNTGDNRDEDILFATQRFDRCFEEPCKKIDGLSVPMRLHQEDFAQALGVASLDKYENNKQGYLKNIFDILRKHSAQPVTDQLKLWDYLIFDFLIGNTDNHIKNISLLYSPDLSSLRLAPAYDILSTAVYESSTRNMSLFIGEQNNLDRISRESFEEAAFEIGLGRKPAMQHFDNLSDRFEGALKNAMLMLKEQRMPDVEDLRERIMEFGGIAKL